MPTWEEVSAELQPVSETDSYALVTMLRGPVSGLKLKLYMLTLGCHSVDCYPKCGETASSLSNKASSLLNAQGRCPSGYGRDQRSARCPQDKARPSLSSVSCPMIWSFVWDNELLHLAAI